MADLECSLRKKRKCVILWFVALQYVWRRHLKLDIIVSHHLGGRLGRQVAVSAIMAAAARLGSVILRSPISMDRGNENLVSLVAPPPS